jgi:hypothetical protein
VRADFDTVYSYIGAAPSGSSESAAVWRITRITISPAVVVETAVDVAWDDRFTETYS